MSTEIMDTDTQSNFAAIDSKPHGFTWDGVDLEWLPIDQLVAMFNALAPRAEQQRVKAQDAPDILTDQEEALFEWISEHLAVPDRAWQWHYNWNTHQLERRGQSNGL